VTGLAVALVTGLSVGAPLKSSDLSIHVVYQSSAAAPATTAALHEWVCVPYGAVAMSQHCIEAVLQHCSIQCCDCHSIAASQIYSAAIAAVLKHCSITVLLVPQGCSIAALQYYSAASASVLRCAC
jgi:hypothetical protein